METKETILQIISNVIEKQYSTEAKNNFLNLEGLEGIGLYPAHIQRISINRALSIALLKWRGKYGNDVPVYEMIGLLENGNDIKEWSSRLLVQVIPFLKKNCILS